MKIAMVGPYPMPGDPISGGVARVIDTLLRAMAPKAKLTLIVPNSNSDAEIEIAGARIIYLARSRGPGSLTYWTSDARRVAQTVERVEPDIVHFQGAAGAARFVQRPSVLSVHGILHRDLLFAHAGGLSKQIIVRLLASTTRAVERANRKKIGNVIVINPYVVSELPDIAELRLFQIPNPIDAVFVDSPQQNQIRARRIVSVGRLSARKNTTRAVEIAARVLKDDQRATATFYGAPDHPEVLQKCREIASTLGVGERILFPGNLTATELCAALDSASVFLMASQQETAPVAIAEAHARGVAVLAPNAFGIPHMIDTKLNGVFLPQAELELQAESLQMMLSNSWDRAAISRAAKATYAPQTVAQRTMETYENILAESAVRRR